MAGLDGVRNQIHPGAPMDQDLYCLSQHEAAELPTVAGSLAEAITALDQDRAFLKEGGVFNDELIDGYIQLKQQEIIRLQSTTHPVEFDMYYSL
jgi:glutamine synthetase